jgi:hypothetical protein
LEFAVLQQFFLLSIHLLHQLDRQHHNVTATIEDF